MIKWRETGQEKEQDKEQEDKNMEENRAGERADHNGIGFNGVDAPFLSSCAEGVKKHGKLTQNQATHVRKALKKYLGQLVEIANERHAYKEVTSI